MKKIITALFFLVILFTMSPVFSELPEIHNLDKAEGLNSLGLFRGSDTGFDLDKPLKRSEAVVMLLRLLGKEGMALNQSAENPFGDVPSWAEPYIAYAFSQKYCNGISETEFGASENITANQYTTFLLRALGFSDISGDFAWDNSLDKAYEIRLIDNEQYSRLKAAAGSDFLRDDMVLLSYNALKAKMKGSEITLIGRLVDVEKIIPREQAIKSGIYDASKEIITIPQTICAKPPII
jgi:hypothetical protein